MMRSSMSVALSVLGTVLILAAPALADWHTSSFDLPGPGQGVQKIAVDPARNRVIIADGWSYVTIFDEQRHITTHCPIDDNPRCLAVNPITGRYYVAMDGTGAIDTVAVLNTDGAVIKKLAIGDNARDMLVDLDSNRVYVANEYSDNITVIRNDSVVAQIPVKMSPMRMALNPVNRSIYLSYDGSDSIACIRMDGNAVTHLYSGKSAHHITVVASLNKAYVSNSGEDSVAVFNCATNTLEDKIGVGDLPFSNACDPSAQKVYVANMGANTVSAINCSTNTVTSTFTVKATPTDMAFNPVTRKLYVSNGDNDPYLMIIDCRTGAKDSLHIHGDFIYTLALNPVTNRVYLAKPGGASDSLMVIDGSNFARTNKTVQNGPNQAAVNQVTGEVYVSNNTSNSVTVIQPSGGTTNIPVGAGPWRIAVNPLTNKAFVINYSGKSVSVIDGSTYAVERTIPVDTMPWTIAVNPLTNYIYVGSQYYGSYRIKVIDGKDWDTTSILVGQMPNAIAVNPVTNRIYVANASDDSVAVIDGARHSVIAMVHTGDTPSELAVNHATNTIYCMNTGGDNVTVIDGATNAATNVPVGNAPHDIAVNIACNKVYVTHNQEDRVVEIDGDSQDTASIFTLDSPMAIAADPVTNRVFVIDDAVNRMTIIDCASRDTMSVPTGSYPFGLAVDRAGGKVYVTNFSSNSVTIVDQTVEQNTRVNSYDYNTDPWDRMFPGSTQNRLMTVINQWSPSKTKIYRGLFSLTSQESFWKFGSNSAITDSSLTWETGNGWGADTAMYGENIFRRFGLESQAGTSNNLGAGTPFVGNILVYAMYRVDYAGPTVAWWDSLPDDNDSLDGYGPYQVRGAFTDFSGIDSAVLYYAVSGGPWTPVTMTSGAADSFFTDIPAQTVAFEDTQSVTYYIVVRDHAHGVYNHGNNTNTGTRIFHLRNPNGVAGCPADPGLPGCFAMKAAYPNPSRGVTTFKYQLPKAVDVRLTVYNVMGQKVQTFNEGTKPAGYHQISWYGKQAAAGVYIYRLQAGSFTASGKLTLLR